jgi:hypothetical protein
MFVVEFVVEHLSTKSTSKKTKKSFLGVSEKGSKDLSCLLADCCPAVQRA